MENETNQLDRRTGRWVMGGMFAALFCYVWLQIRPDLIYYTFGTYSQYPTFNPGGDFFRLQLSLAGGLVSYLGNFLSQTFIVSWLGTATIVFVCGLLYFSGGFLFHSLRPALKRLFGWLAVIGVTMIWQQYNHPMNLSLGLAMNLAAAATAIRLESRQAVVRMAVFTGMMILLYWWTGAMSMVFGGILVIHAVAGEGRLLEGVVLAGVGAAAIWIPGRWAFCLESWEVWKIHLPIHPSMRAELKPLSRICADAIVAATVVLYLGNLLVHRWLRRKQTVAAHPRAGKPRGHDRNRAKTYMRIAIPYILMLGLSALGLEYSRRWNLIFDSHPLNLEAGLAARNGQWQQVVHAADALKRQGVFHLTTVHDTNRALVHLGQMGDRMFEYPQIIHALLFYTVEGLAETLQYDKISGLMLDLDGLNPAEHYATEILEIQGNCPFILERLAAIARAKGQVQAAGIFEAALRKQPAHWLEAQFAPKIAESRALGREPSALRSGIGLVSRNHESRETTPDEILLDLLATNPGNRMAFEYLMAYYLITLQQEKAVSQFYRLKDLGYPRLPRHYAEAAMIALDKTRGKIDLQGWQIDPEIVNQYRMIGQRFREYRSDRQTARVALAPEFGNSYFYYSMFNQSGVRP